MLAAPSSALSGEAAEIYWYFKTDVSSTAWGAIISHASHFRGGKKSSITYDKPIFDVYFLAPIAMAFISWHLPILKYLYRQALPPSMASMPCSIQNTAKIYSIMLCWVFISVKPFLRAYYIRSFAQQPAWWKHYSFKNRYVNGWYFDCNAISLGCRNR